MIICRIAAVGENYNSTRDTVLILMVALLVAVPCEAASDAKISRTKAKLFVGETLQLKVTGGAGTVTWKTSDKKIVMVSKDGLVTAKKTGTCKITATKGKKKLTCTIQVTELPKRYATINGKRVKDKSVCDLAWCQASEKT